MKKICLLFFCAALFSPKAEASDWFNAWWQDTEKNIADVWHDGRGSVYIPVNAWHNRLAYDKRKIKKYNEAPWGFGVGKYRYDEEGHWHGLYVMGFKDSNYHLQTMGGYAYQHNWHLDDAKNWRIGAGYTLGLTQRVEYKMIPLPLPLPIAGIGYKHFNLQAAYVPGIKNYGNVLFTWLRVDF